MYYSDDKFGNKNELRQIHKIGNDGRIEMKDGSIFSYKEYQDTYGERTEGKAIKDINKIFKRPDYGEFVIVYKKTKDIYSTDPKESFYKIMTKKEFELANKYGIGFCPRESEGQQGDGIVVDSTYVIKSPEECPEEIVKQLNNKQKKLEKLNKKIASNRFGNKYDKLGHIAIPIYGKHHIAGYYFDEDEKIPALTGTIMLEVTQAELIQAGFIPEDLGWSSHIHVAPKDIANRTIKGGIGNNEIGNVGKFFNSLKEKVTGKGEK